ncbi:MAG: ABC transporter ATP-binding protein [Microthrixaceae bacterium]|nr:ABC transporter ATP-binding protein [Microthrixaceae bacterium]HPB44670.1 ABC transporter ATP-binding protein [Microthrixaceae bacterium]
MTEAPISPAEAGRSGIAIRTESLTKTYGTNRALDSLSVQIESGTVCGLIGPNGAGKSTLMSILATLLRPTSGSAEIFGIPLTDTEAIRPIIGYVPDVLGMYSGLTVQEYLDFFAEAYRLPRDTRGATIEGLLELVDLSSKRYADVNTLSRGMKQRIGLARGLIHQPRLLILDEPASGLDPRARIELRDIINHLRELGMTVLISSHILGELEEMCTHGLIVEQGRLVGFESLADEPTRSVEVRLLDGSTKRFEVPDLAAQRDLIRSLIHEGFEVVAVTEVSTRLEDRFLRLTEGQVN